MVSRSFSISIAVLAFASVISNPVSGNCAPVAGPGIGTTGNPHIQSTTAIGEVFGGGEKYIAVAIEYDKAIDAAKLSSAAFSVTGRTVTKVYTNSSPAISAHGTGGRFVIVELSADDPTAVAYSGGPGGPGGFGGPGGRGGPNGPGGPGGDRPPGQPENAGPNRPPMGMGANRPQNPVKLTVAQVGNVATATGEVYPGSSNTFENDKTVNQIADEFKQFEFNDPQTGKSLPYNLFMPRGYDKNKTYPLVLFMHDASVTGAGTTRTLTQGLGAVIWATPEEQAKHPAFVLAPAFGAGFSTEGAEGDATADTVVHLVNAVAGQYSIDKNRMYTTGQSFGCMLSLAILIRYPNLFAASLLVAGQRDADLTSVLNHDKMWIIVAQGDTRAFPGMNASIAVWEKEGATVSKATWNARDSDAQLSADAKTMMAEGNNIKYASFLKGTVFPPGKEGGIEHMATWPVAYNITAVRDWLFAQHR